ncbi:MAG: DUF1415 domain-containing protein [Sandaracinaceae bacterium]|nr:MAG: DUF1415 domain-containing protein [Sandaracinaceae bacterium]
MSDGPLEETARWIEEAVLGLSLCPFARVPWERERVHLALTDAPDEDGVAAALDAEIAALMDAPRSERETSLLVCTGCMADFGDFNEFLGVADALLAARGLEGVLQVASFHPAYRFRGEPEDDPAHFTNRSPYPTLHLLREESVSEAVLAHPDPDAIWQRNVVLLRGMSREVLRKLRGGPA